MKFTKTDASSRAYLFLFGSLRGQFVLLAHPGHIAGNIWLESSNILIELGVRVAPLQLVLGGIGAHGQLVENVHLAHLQAHAYARQAGERGRDSVHLVLHVVQDLFELDEDTLEHVVGGLVPVG